jgi:hypothetical protein
MKAQRWRKMISEEDDTLSRRAAPAEEEAPAQ